MSDALPTPSRPSRFGPPTDTELLHRQLVARGDAPAEDLLQANRVHDLYMMHSFACQLRCDYCWLWGETGLVWDKALKRKYSERIPLEVMKGFIDALVPYGIRNLNLSGGEPLMTSTWFELVQHARARGLPTQLTTGGVLIADELERIVEGLDQLNVSINGPPSIADKVRPGPDGHYQQMVRGLKALTEARRAHGGGPEVRVLSTITHTNYAHVVEMVDYFERAGIDVDRYYFQFLIFNSAEDLARQAEINREEFGCGIESLTKYTVEPVGIDFDRMWEELQEVRRRRPDTQFSAPLTRETLERYYRGDKWGIVPDYCATPWTELALLPNGDVYTCPDLPIGNILEQPFDEIWNGAKVRRLRERVSKQLFPTCTGCFHYWGDRGIALERQRRAGQPG